MNSHSIRVTLCCSAFFGQSKGHSSNRCWQFAHSTSNQKCEGWWTNNGRCHLGKVRSETRACRCCWWGRFFCRTTPPQEAKLLSPARNLRVSTPIKRCERTFPWELPRTSPWGSFQKWGTLPWRWAASLCLNGRGVDRGCQFGTRVEPQ